jgi:hypothetical protein
MKPKKEIIIDLLGDKLEIKSGQYEICPDFPHKQFAAYEARYTRDRLTGRSCSVLYTLDRTRWAIIYYASWMSCYVVYEAKHIGYEEKYDMRKEYIYGRH